jgi:centromeric protein E
VGRSYRDSKLTRLLSSSLGGNACTAVMCAISPAERNYEESCGTLKFATFSASVINKVTVNVVADSGAMLKEYKGEIEELKAKSGAAEGRLKDIIDLLIKAKESQLVERDYNFAAKLIDMQMGVATGDLTLAEQIQEIEAIVETKKQEDPSFFEGDPRPQRAQGGRKMSTMSMNNLARISQMHASLISEEERVQLQETIAEEDEEEDANVEELKEQVEDLEKKVEELEESLAERDTQIAKHASVPPGCARHCGA